MKNRINILARCFPLTAVVLAVVGVFEFWLAGELRINPVCGASVPDWMPAWGSVVLLVFAFPGWLGMFLVHGLNGQALPQLPVALVSQFLAYFGIGHLVALTARKISSRRKRKGIESDGS